MVFHLSSLTPFNSSSSFTLIALSSILQQFRSHWYNHVIRTVPTKWVVVVSRCLHFIGNAVDTLLCMSVCVGGCVCQSKRMCTVCLCLPSKMLSVVKNTTCNSRFTYTPLGVSDGRGIGGERESVFRFAYICN